MRKVKIPAKEVKTKFLIRKFSIYQENKIFKGERIKAITKAIIKLLKKFNRTGERDRYINQRERGKNRSSSKILISIKISITIPFMKIPK